MLNEQARIKDQRMERTPGLQRPRYTPIERMQILEHKTIGGWSLRQTGRHFLVAPGTIAAWTKRIDQGGSAALLQMELTEPVNKFPEFVRYSIQRLKTLCPQLGKAKMAEILCRVGLHLGATTIGRILKEQPAPVSVNDVSNQGVPQNGNPPRVQDFKNPNSPCEQGTNGQTSKTIVTAKHPNHVWHVDMTVVPTGKGFYTTWMPCSLPQCWPFCWWVVIAMDHFSRKAIGFALFKKQPTAFQVRTFLGRVMGKAKAKPKYLISDKGCQFWCGGYKRWCQRKKIKPRFGAIGQHSSIAVIERFNRTFKQFNRSLALVSMAQKSFRDECVCFMDWYNEHRPHATLNGKTPNEVYSKEKFPANRKPRIEPREKWPRASFCAKPQTLVAGQPGDRFLMRVDFYQGHQHLPIVTLSRSA